MKRKVFIRTNEVLTYIFVSIFIFMGIPHIQAETILYQDHSVHLTFMLDTETHEATIGNGTYDSFNARAYPPSEDPYWTTNDNIWANIVVPETVTYNGEAYTVVGMNTYAFYKQTEIETIQLPNTIRHISDYAFAYAEGLKSIIIPEGVETIGTCALKVCRALDTIVLPSTIKSIGIGAFSNCVSLRQINIPGNCLSIDIDAFTWCDKLSTLIIEDGTEPLSLSYTYQFGEDYVSRQPCLHTNAYYAVRFYRGLFADCDLKYVYIGRNIEHPEVYPDGNRYSPFEDCYCYTYSIYQQNISHLGKSLNRIEFGESVTSIPDLLFYKCSNNEDIVLPPHIKYIGSHSFSDCLQNQSVLEIPASCDSIGISAFAPYSKSTLLKFIVSHSPTPPALGDKLSSGIITYVPAGSGAMYRQHPYWGANLIIDPADELVTIDVKYPGALYGRLSIQDKEPKDVCRLKITGSLNKDDMATINSMSNLYELDMSESEIDSISGIGKIAPHLSYIQFPRNLTSIPPSFFYSSNLQDTIIIPASCSSIGNNAFNNSPIKYLIIEGSTDVANNAFTNCKHLQCTEIYGEGTILQKNAFYNSGASKAIIGKGVIVQENAFGYCSHLKELVLLDGVDSIYSNAFYQVNLEKIEIKGLIHYLDEKPFPHSSSTLQELHIGNLSQWCKNHFATSGSNPMSMASKVLYNGNELTEVILPDGIDSINDYSFVNCKSLHSVHLPNSVQHIGIGAFAECTNLDTITMPDSLTYLGKGAFQYCRQLKGCQLSENLLAINDVCFEGCTSLVNITLPPHLQNIGNFAFSNCPLYEKITFPPFLETIGARAFYGCKGITSIVFPWKLLSIGESAFAECSNLQTIQAPWIDPFSINLNTFTNIDKKSTLWVPHGSIERYYTAGWGRISLITEGFYTILVSSEGHGSVQYGDISTRSNEEILMVDIENVPDSIVFIFEPDSSYYIQHLLLDSVDITQQMTLKNHQVILSDIHDNGSLSAQFEKFEIGDANVDNYVDVGDIASIVNYIRETPIGTFRPEAADVNCDTDIDVGDIVGEVNLIYEIANHSTPDAAPMRSNTMSSITHNYSVYLGELEILPNEDIILPIHLDNNTAVRGFQMEMMLPEGLIIPRDERGNYLIERYSERLEGMNIYTISSLSNNRYQVLCSSTNQTSIQGDEGVLFNITLRNESLSQEEEYTIDLAYKIADANGKVHSYNEEANIALAPHATTSISELKEESSDMVHKYVENGCFYIVKNGAKYTISGVRVL